MFEWELVKVNAVTGAERKMFAWSSDELDENENRRTCGFHGRGEHVAELYVSFGSYRRELFQVWGDREALDKLQHPRPGFTRV